MYGLTNGTKSEETPPCHDMAIANRIYSYLYKSYRQICWMNLAKIYKPSTGEREDAKNLFLSDDLLAVIRFQGIKIAFLYGYYY